MNGGPSKLVRVGVGFGTRIEPVTGGVTFQQGLGPDPRATPGDYLKTHLMLELDVQLSLTALACDHALWELPTEPLTG